VQTDFGHTAEWAGLVLAPGGLVTMVMFAVVGRLSAKVQPRYLIMIGALFAALSMYGLTNRPIYTPMSASGSSRIRG
jgi:MFS transporter, DHA2 family, multidrug resistance protein